MSSRPTSIDFTQRPRGRAVSILLSMHWIITVIVCIFLSSCSAPQPESIKTVAAFEIPLQSPEERERFLSLLHEVAEEHGMHVDTATQEDLDQMAKASTAFKMTMNAAVWKGINDDEEVIASAMDQSDHLGHIWLSFCKGENPALNSRFREAAMIRIMENWPETLSIPITPTGGLPLRKDLIRTPKGYVVDPDKTHKYAPAHSGEASQ